MKPRATITDVARLAKVSKKTVSRVINESPFVKSETRAKVAALMRQMDYQPDPQARGLASRSSFLIGLVYDNPNAQYIVNMQDGALDALRGREFEIVVHPCDRRAHDFVAGVGQFARRQKLRGVILLPPLSEHPQLIAELESIGCEYVQIVAMRDASSPRAIVSNDRDATAEVARYLDSLGHRHIGFLGGPSEYRSARERQAGFLEALEQRGLRLPAQYIIEGSYSFESGVACAEVLLSRTPRPTAIFACNDEMAAGVYRVAYALGLKIPRDLSVVGFDDSALASRLWPSLTTVRLPIRDMGRLAAMKLLGGTGEPGVGSVVFPHLIVRDSSGAPGLGLGPAR